MPVVAGTAPLTILAYGHGRDQVDVEIIDGGDLRVATVTAARRLRLVNKTISDSAWINLKRPDHG